VSQVDLAHRLQSLKRAPADLSYSVVADVQHLKARSYAGVKVSRGKEPGLGVGSKVKV